MRILIMGAGIGGVAAGIALRRAGHDVVQFERAPEACEVGAGIALGANAVMALDAIGAAEPVTALADTIAAADLLDWRGRVLLHTPVAEIERDLPAHSVLVHRADLLGALLSRLSPGSIRFGRSCVGFDQDSGGVRARFADGSVESGEALVGADGIRSAVRAALHGDDSPRYSGYTGWRGIAPGAAGLVEEGRTCELWGRGSRFGYGRCGGGRVYWYATSNTPAGGMDDADPRPMLLRSFGTWAHPVPELIRLTSASAVLRNDIVDRPPTRRWGEGRTTLLGDAAHATTPNLGQGACMAIEDGVVLARHLKGVSSPGQIDAALRSYEQSRMTRTAMVTNMSWRLGRVGQWETPWAIAVRNAVMRHWPESGVRRQIRGLVAHRVSV